MPHRRRRLPAQGTRAAQELLEWSERLGRSGSWEWVVETGELIFSENLFRIFGIGPGPVAPTTEVVADLIHPEDVGRYHRAVRSMARSGRPKQVSYRILLADGAVRHLTVTIHVIEAVEGRPQRIVGAVQDRTEIHAAQREIATHIAVTEALEAWEGFESGAADLLAGLGEAMGALCAVLWVQDGRRLLARTAWDRDGEDIAQFLAVLRETPLDRSASLPGRAWRSGQPLIGGLAGEERSARVAAATAAGVRATIEIPARTATETLAVIELHLDAAIEPSERLLRSLTGIGGELGHFLERRRGDLQAPVLTEREIEVLALASQGLSGPQIAARLHRSPSTIKRHFEDIYARLAVADRTAAVAMALRRGWIS
jgi:DNA-binding CsgD family transcriptional regulator